MTISRTANYVLTNSNGRVDFVVTHNRNKATQFKIRPKGKKMSTLNGAMGGAVLARIASGMSYDDAGSDPSSDEENFDFSSSPPLPRAARTIG